jgi:predicted dithiol-disulfide oxidoreductase (DUF899 family)
MRPGAQHDAHPTSEAMVDQPKVVSRAEWTAARKALLVKEKEFDRRRDALSAERRKLPWVKVEKNYLFDGGSGTLTLGDLFAGRRQLIVYHFMLDPSWSEGCKSCSYLADNFQGAIVHMAARDTSFVAISRAPLTRIEAFKKRMGWTFRWVSSEKTEFNYDYHVSFRPEDVANGTAEYNYEKAERGSESPGASVFIRDGEDVFHTYSTYARGLDLLIGTYNYLDLTPIGRNEGGLEYPMAWIRHHDSYPSK